MYDEIRGYILYRLKNSGLIQKYFVEPEIEGAYGMLSHDELKYIIALSEVIYLCANKQEKKKLHAIVKNWTKQRNAKDGYLILFRQGIDFIRLQTKKSDFDRPFYDLSIAERAKIVDKPEYMRTDMYNSPGFNNPFTLLKFVLGHIINHKQDRKFFFFETLRKDLIKGIFNSELGWNLAGYESWPGNRGEYWTYIQPLRTNNVKQNES